MNNFVYGTRTFCLLATATGYFTILHLMFDHTSYRGRGGEREALLQHSSCTGYLRLLSAVTIHTYCSLPILSYSAVYVCRLISGGVSPPQDLSVIYGYYPILYTSIYFYLVEKHNFVRKLI